MLSRIRARVTYANVIATLALFIALGTGGAFAAATITGADIVDGSVTGADIKGSATVAGSLTGFDIQDGTIAPVDLQAGAVRTGKILDGAVTGAKIADGSVTTADLAPSVLGGLAHGQTLFARQVIPMDHRLYFPGGIGGLFYVGTQCDASFNAMTFDNQTDETMDVVRVDEASTSPSYQQLGPESGSDFRWNIDLPTTPSVQEFHLSTPSGRSATVWVAHVPRSATSDCVEMVQAVATS